MVSYPKNLPLHPAQTMPLFASEQERYRVYLRAQFVTKYMLKLNPHLACECPCHLGKETHRGKKCGCDG